MTPLTNAALQHRLRLIDFLLDHYGTIRRKQIMDYFGISLPQATLDFAAYYALAPANLEYDLSARTYRKAAGFQRLLP